VGDTELLGDLGDGELTGAMHLLDGLGLAGHEFETLAACLRA
jgi:hypothetical protein